MRMESNGGSLLSEREREGKGGERKQLEREVEVGEEREACQHFVLTSCRGKHKQTASDSSRRRGGEMSEGEESRKTAKRETTRFW